MPILGEVIKDRHSHTLIWQRCEQCGKERWVRCIRGVPRSRLCMECHGGGHYTDSKRGKDTWVIGDGYVAIRNLLHPRAWKCGGMRRARFNLEQALGRPLKKGMVVHHINGNKQDDHPENLIEITRQEHAKLHHQLRQLTVLEVDQHRNKNSNGHKQIQEGARGDLIASGSGRSSN